MNKTEEYHALLRRIGDTVDTQSRVIGMQKEIIDELYRLLLMHVSASDMGALNEKIKETAKAAKEVEE